MRHARWMRGDQRPQHRPGVHWQGRWRITRITGVPPKIRLGCKNEHGARSRGRSCPLPDATEHVLLLAGHARAAERGPGLRELPAVRRIKELRSLRGISAA
jgi:hypothetical protein